MAHTRTDGPGKRPGSKAHHLNKWPVSVCLLSCLYDEEGEEEEEEGEAFNQERTRYGKPGNEQLTATNGPSSSSHAMTQLKSLHEIILEEADKLIRLFPTLRSQP
jgi:hypothetical protein